LGPTKGRRSAVAARAEQLADVGEERGLADAARDQADVRAGLGLGKAVAERSSTVS
jgi:hypothetical protein